MSACCLTPPVPAGTQPSAAEAVTSVDQIAAAGFGAQAQLAIAAAFSPNPGKPPLYLDLPTKAGQLQPDVVARWAANAPVALVPQYVFALRRLTALAFDVGTSDGLRTDAAALDLVLTEHKLPHVFETYDGNHINRVAERIETTVMLFFSKYLADK